MEVQEYKLMDEIENKHAWFVAKKNILNLIIGKFIGGTSLKVLDVGCGTGAILEYFKNRGDDVRGVDISDVAVGYCQNKCLNVSIGSAESTGFADHEFDLVVALDVLEHLDDDRLAIREFNRVLKDDGYIIATVPAHQSLFSYHDKFLHHRRRYGREQFKSLFSGFDIQLLSWIHSSILIPVAVMRLIKKIFHLREEHSDAKSCAVAVNNILNFIYYLELGIFKRFGFLPMGLSLIVVAKKYGNK